MNKAAMMYEGIVGALKSKRKSLGYSQERVAKAIGVHPYRISLYENMVHVPNAEIVANWASALGMTLVAKEGE